MAIKRQVITSAPSSDMGNTGLERRSPAPPRDSLKLKILLAFGGLVVGLVLVEICVRIFLPLSAAHAWSHRPKEYFLPEGALDSRDFPYTVAKTENTFRVAVVGDSFTFGGAAQFYDSLPKRLEMMLNLNQTQKRAEVMNWGVPGESTQKESLRVRDAFDRFQTDLVILQITLNDPELKSFRATHSYQDPQGGVTPDTGLFKVWRTLGLLRQRLRYAELDKEYFKYYENLYNEKATWNSFVGAIKRIGEIAHNRHKTVFAVIFPLFSDEINEHYRFLPFHQKIQAKLTELNIPYTDLMSQYRGIPPEYLQVNPGKDEHPNEIAYRIATDAVYSELVNRDLVPAELRPHNVVKRRHAPAIARGVEGAAHVSGFAGAMR